MTNKVYRTAQGKVVDMGALQLQNEHTRAVGNMNVNARGDSLNEKNEVIERKAEKVGRKYDYQVTDKQNADVPMSESEAVSTSSKSAIDDNPLGPMDEQYADDTNKKDDGFSLT